MSEANNKVRTAVKIYDFGNGVRFLYPFNYGGKEALSYYTKKRGKSQSPAEIFQNIHERQRKPAKMQFKLHPCLRVLRLSASPYWLALKTSATSLMMI